MSVWFRRVEGLDTATMREIANNADVNWSSESIIYRGRGIGFANAAPDDVGKLQDAAEDILGYRPVSIDAPPKPDAEA